MKLRYFIHSVSSRDNHKRIVDDWIKERKSVIQRLHPNFLGGLKGGGKSSDDEDDPPPRPTPPKPEKPKKRKLIPESADALKRLETYYIHWEIYLAPEIKRDETRFAHARDEWIRENENLIQETIRKHKKAYQLIERHLKMMTTPASPSSDREPKPPRPKKPTPAPSEFKFSSAILKPEPIDPLDRLQTEYNEWMSHLDPNEFDLSDPQGGFCYAKVRTEGQARFKKARDDWICRNDRLIYDAFRNRDNTWHLMHRLAQMETTYAPSSESSGPSEDEEKPETSADEKYERTPRGSDDDTLGIDHTKRYSWNNPDVHGSAFGPFKDQNEDPPLEPPAEVEKTAILNLTYEKIAEAWGECEYKNDFLEKNCAVIAAIQLPTKLKIRSGDTWIEFDDLVRAWRERMPKLKEENEDYKEEDREEFVEGELYAQWMDEFETNRRDHEDEFVTRHEDLIREVKLPTGTDDTIRYCEGDEDGEIGFDELIRRWKTMLPLKLTSEGVQK
jgi:hypothetical protein